LFKKCMQTLEHIIARVSYASVYISGVMAVLMAFLAAYGVIRRYALDDPEPYSYEISTIFLLAGVVLAIPYIQKVGRHLRVDILSNRFPQGVQTILLNIFVPILAIFYISPMTWQSWENACYSLRIGETTYSAWAPPLFPIKIWVPIGVGLLCIVLFAQLIHGLYLLKGSITKTRQ
jgi:TRAP-type mannitol/chloroaromatic compound transport system permease small subunit